MLQAALDSRSPTTPRIKPGNKRSSPEIASSSESPYKKRNWHSPSDGKSACLDKVRGHTTIVSNN